jgi:hypothetical protein
MSSPVIIGMGDGVLVKLTRTISRNHYKGPVWVNLSLVHFWEPYEAGARIEFNDGDMIFVTESIDQIAALLAQGRSWP